MVKIAVTFELGAECLLTVTARERNTGKVVQAVMSAREGATAAKRRLEADGPDGSARTPPAQPVPGAAAATVTGGLGGVLRKVFGRKGEAR